MMLRNYVLRLLSEQDQWWRINSSRMPQGLSFVHGDQQRTQQNFEAVQSDARFL